MSAPDPHSTDAAASARPGSPWAVHAALLAAQTGFALFPILGKVALGEIPPLTLAAIRVVCAAVVLEAVRRAGGERELEPRDRKAVFLYALLGVSFNQMLFILGLSMTTAINTSLLTATIPVFTLAVAVLLGRERMAPAAAAGVVLATAGVLVLLDVSRFDFGSRHLRGNLLILANSLSYSFYLVLSRPILARYGARTIVSRLFLYGSGPILLLAAPSLMLFSPAAVPPIAWACLAGIVVFCTVLPYLSNSWALARTVASRVAFYVFLQPLIASLLAVTLLGESLSRRTIAAAGLIFSGMAVTMWRRLAPAHFR
ncbi:MAG: DMT family transporter [Acidobacteriota bacterium]|nr:DMT family transporter [Acidobacteriota bacterium]